MRLLAACVAFALAACSEDPDPPSVSIAEAQAGCSDGERCFNRDTVTRDLQGVRLIYKRVPGAPISAVRVMLDGGARRWTARSAHAEGLLIQLTSWWGSQHRTTDWDHALGHIGATIRARSGNDYASWSLIVPTPHFDAGFDLLAAAVNDPPIRIQSSVLERSKVAYVDGYETEGDEPRNAANLAAWSLLTQGHPYALLRRSLDQVSSVQLSDLDSVHRELTQRTPMTVSIVGDVEMDRVATMVQEAFGSPSRQVTLGSPGLPAFTPSSESRVQFVRAANAPTWYIDAYFAAPPPAGEPAAALSVGLRVLQTRLQHELRTARGLVYAVSAGMSNIRTNYGWLELSTDRPAEAMPIVGSELERLLREGIEDVEVEAARAQFVTEFNLDNQSVASQSWLLGDWQLTSGDRALVDEQLLLVGMVSASAAREAVAAYVKDLRYGVAGPGEALNEAEVFGP